MHMFEAQDVPQRARRQGVIWRSPALRSPIWVRTWAQIIHDCKTRLKIFQKELNHSADRDASLAYLKKTYARVLQGGEASQSDNSDHDVAGGDASTVGQ